MKHTLNLVITFAGLFVAGSIFAASATAQDQVLPTWMGSFKYGGTNYNYTMVGTDPTTNSTTTVNSFVVPVKLVFSKGCSSSPTCSFDSQSVVSRVVSSPIFDSSTTYVQGGVNLGTTQYIDAFQRGNFWGTVKNNPNYHLKLGGPSVLAELTITVPATEGCVGSIDFGYPVGEVDYSWLETQIENYVSLSNVIEPNTLPIFLTYQAVISVGAPSCNGASGPPTQGVHFSNYGQTFVQFGYLDPNGSHGLDPVQPDVSILAHEVGEWADDPYVSNYPTPCGTNLEVGDPLIGHNYAYTVNNFTYHLQDLVFITYFGAPAGTSVNNWYSFQDEKTGGPCS